MSFSIPGVVYTRHSSGDMSAHQYKAVVASTANGEEGCTVVATRGAKLTGIWGNNSTAQEAGPVQLTGIAKVAAGDSSGMDTAITQGSFVVCSSKGAAVPSTGAANQYFIGVALESLSTGSTGIIAVALTIGGLST